MAQPRASSPQRHLILILLMTAVALTQALPYIQFHNPKGRRPLHSQWRPSTRNPRIDEKDSTIRDCVTHRNDNCALTVATCCNTDPTIHKDCGTYDPLCHIYMGQCPYEEGIVTPWDIHQ